MTVATKLTPKKRKKFLSELAACGNVTRACELAATTRDSVYKLRKRDEEFNQQWEEARTVAADALEDEAWRRGMEGAFRELSYQGKLTGDLIKEYSDTLLIFLLKGNKPEKFAERHKHDGTVKTENTVIYLPDNGRD